MGQTHDESTQHLAERLCWQVARRDDTRVARRLYRQPRVDGVYRLDAGARLDDCFHVLQAVKIMAVLEQVHGTAIQREMLPCVQAITALCTGAYQLSKRPAQRAEGSRVVEALMTVVATRQQQHRHGLDDVTAACEVALCGEPAPSLLPTPDALNQGMRPAASLGTPGERLRELF